MNRKRACLSYLLLVILLLSHFALSVNEKNDSLQSLFKKIFTDTNAKIRPLRNQSDILYLDIFLHISSIIDISEVDQRVEINGWVNLSWIDELRVWDPQEYDGTDVFFPEPGDSWSPRLLVTNSVDKSDVFEDGHTYHFLFANGSTRFYPSGVFRISCNMKMSYFPFDTQVCHLRILTKYLSPYVKFRVPEKANKDAAITSFSTHGEWDIFDVKQSVSDEVFDNEFYSVCIISFHLTRKPVFVVLVVVLPVILLSVISLHVFLLPVESGEKVSFSITVLLTLSVFTSFVSDLLPRNSQSIPILVFYLFALMVLTGLAVVTTIVLMASGGDRACNLLTPTGPMNNNALTVDDEELANDIRLQRSSNANAFGDSDTMGFDFRSSFKRASHRRAPPLNHGGGTAASHVNQWRSSDQTSTQNGIYHEAMETHSSSLPNGSTHDGFDSHLHERHQQRRRSSTVGVRAMFDRLYFTRRNSAFLFATGSTNEREEDSRRSCSPQFLCMIPRRDKLLYCSFLLAWMLLTIGFVISTAL